MRLRLCRLHQPRRAWSLLQDEPSVLCRRCQQCRLLSARRRLHGNHRPPRPRHRHRNAYRHHTTTRTARGLIRPDRGPGHALLGTERILPIPCYTHDIHKCGCLLSRLLDMPRGCCRLHERPGERPARSDHQWSERRSDDYGHCKSGAGKRERYLLQSESKGLLGADCGGLRELWWRQCCEDAVCAHVRSWCWCRRGTCRAAAAVAMRKLRLMSICFYVNIGCPGITYGWHHIIWIYSRFPKVPAATCQTSYVEGVTVNMIYEEWILLCRFYYAGSVRH